MGTVGNFLVLPDTPRRPVDGTFGNFLKSPDALWKGGNLVLIRLNQITRLLAKTIFHLNNLILAQTVKSVVTLVGDTDSQDIVNS